MKTSEIVQNAHDFLLAHKWLRHELAKTTDGEFLYRNTKVQLVARGDGSGRVIDCCCAEGAIAAGNPQLSLCDLDRAAKAVRNIALNGDSLVGFNDSTAHDKRDVLRKFRVAIRALKKEGN